jgi:hypothetical protein
VSEPSKYAGLWKDMLLLGTLAVAVLAAFTGVALFFAGEGSPPKNELTLNDSRAFYASQPEFLRPFPYTAVPEGLPDLRAETCGSCHREIYAEWKVSTHARAWEDDAQYQEELAKTKATPGKDASWICVNCHTPLVNQLPRLVAGLEDGALDRPIYVRNLNYNVRLQLEAITCASCHVRDGVVLGPYGDTDAPHPVRKAPELLEAKQCTQCHQADHYLKEIELACVFDTGADYAKGPAPERGETCQTCHMPEVERRLAKGYPVRKTRRHWFGGSLIPKHPKFKKELEPLLEVYPDGVELSWVDLPAQVAPGAEFALTFAAANRHAGHKVPTGDPERFLTFRAEVRDAGGKLLAQREERIGSVYEWDPVKKVSDNRISPGERREYSLRVRAPAAGPLRVSLVGSKHRISEENMSYHELEGRYVAGRTYTNQTATIELR